MNQIHSGPMAGKTVLVTGGTAGIGRATAVGLAAMGAHLAITGRDRGRAEDAAREIRVGGGGQPDVFVADLSDQSQARREATSVTANALHPGVVRTSFGAEDPSGAQRLAVPFLRPFMKAPAQGAATSIHLASASELEQVSGRYFAGSEPKSSSRRSYDQAAAARLWQVSADLTHLGTGGSRSPGGTS